MKGLESNFKTTEARDGFKSNWGFILACIGSAVGMGNIWRFPIMVSQWGGLTFLLPYFLFVILIASSGVLGEFSLGRMTGSGPIGAFGKCTEMRGNKRVGEIVGIFPVIGSLALAIGYTVVVGWIFKYTFMALSGSLYKMGTDIALIGGTFGKAAPETETLRESLNVILSGEGGNNIWIIIGLLTGAVVMAMGIGGGIEKVNKFMMPALFLLLLGLGVYIFTLPGSEAGYKYIFTLEPELLKNPKLWVYAFGQAFFSLSVAGNGSIVYGSYLSKKEDLVYSARTVAFFDTVAAILASLVIIPAMASAGGDLSKGGPGLMFVWLVNVFNGMPGGKPVGMVFFVCVLFAGISSLVNLYEAPVATLQEAFKIKRKTSCFIVTFLGCISALAIQGITGQWMDAVSIYICPLGASIAGVMFFYICEKDKIMEAINTGRKNATGNWVILLGRYVYVPFSVIALIAGAALGGIG